MWKTGQRYPRALPSTSHETRDFQHWILSPPAVGPSPPRIARRVNKLDRSADHDKAEEADGGSPHVQRDPPHHVR